MTTGNNYSVGPNENGWGVKRDGASRCSSVHETQAKAIKAGAALAKESEGELRIKGRDGRIRDSDTYGKHDPNPPRDRKH
ncbi:MAG: DUF2188 domain-containing protein [Planctomycetes bacterium]|nr:DUF2188 domain-containing protein [Planctomycetota bacterium]